MEDILSRLIIVIIVAFIIAEFICVFTFMNQKELSFDFGKELIQRIISVYYEKKERHNNYVEYSKIEDSDTDDFINFWYKG